MAAPTRASPSSTSSVASTSSGPGGAGRLFALAGALLFVGSLAYFGWSYRAYGRPVGPWTPDGWLPIVSNVVLFSLFALHHSVFARTGVKAWLTARIPERLERSVYVWISSLLFILTLWAWSPVPGEAWRVTSDWRRLLEFGCLVGVVLTAISAAALDPLDLSGVRQAFGRPPDQRQPLKTSGVYRLVRHPIYFAWVLMVWSLPSMTGTRLVFALVSTVYLMLAIPFEERELRRSFGRAYDEYGHRVRWRMLPWIY